MKDFDQDRKGHSLENEEERTFVLRGERFVVKTAIHPDVLIAYDSISNDSGVQESLDTLDLMVISMIDERDDAAARYRAVRSQKDDPVTLTEMFAVIQWMLAVASGRPTGQPGDSSLGLRSTETASTGDSSSLDAQAA